MSKTFLLSLFAALFLFSSQALAQKSYIHLVAPQKTYTPGQDITAYVFFYRLPAPFGFFQRSWAGQIRHSRDFTLRERTRISGAREELRDARGAPSERITEVFRIRLRARHEGSVLRYGPIRLNFQINFQQFKVTSNTLTFSKQTKPQAGKMTGKVTFPPATHREGRSLQLTYTVKCPQSLCNFRRLNYSQLMSQLRDQVRLTSNSDFWVQSSSITPQINYLDNAKPPSVSVRFDYQVTPLHGGQLSTPPLRVPMPIIETINQRNVIKGLRKWAQARGAPSHSLQQLIQLRENYVYSVTTKPIVIGSKTTTVQAATACQGEWKLSSRLVTEPPSRKFWHVRLQGKGFLLQADRFLRQTIEQTLQTNNLQGKLRLHHYRWKLPDQSLNGRITIDLYFAFKGPQIELPALSMTFMNAQNKSYTQSTSPISLQAHGEPLQERLTPNKQENRIYLSYSRPPSTQQSQPVEIWGYQLAPGFPLTSLLSRRWELSSHFQLTKQTKQGQIVRRTVRNTPFGRSEQVYSQGIHMSVLVGNTHVTLRKGLFNQFPSVIWGGQRFHVAIESSQDVSIHVKTDRKSYFAGEPIFYDILFHCPKSSCPPKEKGFYAKFFSKHLTLPKFDKFSTWKKIEDFQRVPSQQTGWVTLRTRIRFAAPATNQLKLSAASLRLNRFTLYQLFRQHQICLFYNQGRESTLKQAITRDHYNSSGNPKRCSIQTRELSTSELTIPIRSLPASAKGIRLIGTFRIGARLTKLSYPTKRATMTDKPFYLLVDIEGDGDLKTAREQIRDQLDKLAATFRKRSVTTYVELPDDKAMRKENKTRVQLQLIPEEPTTFTIPSLKLKYYHREEGILTAQTLPFTIKVEARNGAVAAPRRRKAPTTRTPASTSVLSDTELRPNAILGTSSLDNQYFRVSRWYHLLLMLGPFGLFLLFLGWHRNQLLLQADPQRQARQKALRAFSEALKQLRPEQDRKWHRQAIDALQNYLIERLSLSQKQLTPSEVERVLSKNSEKVKQATTTALVQQHQQLEAALYGGDAIENPKDFLQQFEQHIRTIDKALPKT